MTTYRIGEVVTVDPTHPDNTRTYTVNMVSEDGTNDASSSDTGFLQSRTISSIAVTTPSGITKDSDSNTTTTFSLTVSGGTDGSDYDFTVACTLSDSDVENVVVRIPVRTPS